MTIPPIRSHAHLRCLMPAYLSGRQVIAATNRPDVLDPALLRSGRLDRKIELPHPSEEARGRILQIHSRKMNVDKSECVVGFVILVEPVAFC